MFDEHVWKFHDPRSIDKNVRGGVKIKWRRDRGSGDVRA